MFPFSPNKPENCITGPGAMLKQMKKISVAGLESDQEPFRRAACKEEIEQPLTDLPLLAGHRPKGKLPSRHEVQDEIVDFKTEQGG